jgi:ABC-2 type transport system permease protein
MKQLLAIEWLKIKGYAAFKLLSIFFIAGVILTNYIVFYVSHLDSTVTGGAQAMLSTFRPYQFAETWHTTSYFSGWLLVLPAMLIVMLLTNEYSFKTHRQNVIDGWSRLNFVSVKLVQAVVFAAASTLLVIVTAAIFGLFSKGSFSLASFYFVGYFFLKALTYNFFAVLISVLVKRTGFAIGLFFVYIGAENLASLMLDGYSVKLKMQNSIDIGNLGSYLPMNAADSLLTFVENPAKSMITAGMPRDIIWLVIILAFVYLVLFAKWAVNKFLHSDL